MTSAGVRAQESDAAAGHAFARKACNVCHAVEAEQRTPRRIVIGPGVSRCRKHLGNDGNRYPRLPKDLAPENAEPNPDTGRDGGCDRLHLKPARSSLRRPGLSRQGHRAEGDEARDTQAFSQPMTAGVVIELSKLFIDW